MTDYLSRTFPNAAKPSDLEAELAGLDLNIPIMADLLRKSPNSVREVAEWLEGMPAQLGPLATLMLYRHLCPITPLCDLYPVVSDLYRTLRERRRDARA